MFHLPAPGRAWSRFFGLFAVVAASGAVAAWLLAEASGPSPQPASVERLAAVSDAGDESRFTLRDPRVLAMEDWQQTTAQTVSKKKTKQQRKQDRYWDNFFYYYFFFYSYYANDVATYNTYYPYYFNYFYFF